ncbi:hypothetical protein [Actinoplanes teichomyceticus]|nr:hypothetical protein [Actinoplanes teichomyceticus]
MRTGDGRGDVRVEVDGTAAKRLDVGEASTPAGPRLRVAPLPIRAPRPTFAAGVIALVLVGVLGVLLINIKTMEQSFRLDALRENQANLNEQQQELKQQLIQVSGPGNLAAAARQQGLVPAGKPARIRLPDGKIIGVPTPGKGPTAPTTGELRTGAAGDGGATQPATGAGAETQAGTGTQTAPGTQAGTGTQTAPGTQAGTGAGTQAGTGAQTGTGTGAQTGTQQNAGQPGTDQNAVGTGK